MEMNPISLIRIFGARILKQIINFQREPHILHIFESSKNRTTTYAIIF